MTAAADLATADLLDRLPDLASTCETQFIGFGGKNRFRGRIATIECLEDNLLVKEALAEDGDGRVLVVDGGGSLRSALLGDSMAATAAAHGWSGVVLSGAVRDVTALREIALGVQALGSNPRPSGKTGAGRRDVDVRIGSTTFRPGDLLVCDEDGVVTLPGHVEWPD